MAADLGDLTVQHTAGEEPRRQHAVIELTLLSRPKPQIRTGPQEVVSFDHDDP
jgi:hypothetical protein